MKATQAAGEQPDLTPCPFCGGEADIDAPTKIDRMVYCKGCYASICEDSTPDAIAAWNRRVPAVSALPQGWQPIETAPKDGTPILVSNSDRGDSWIAMYKAVLTSGFKPDNPWYSLMLNTNWHPNRQGSFWPTHWQALPPPPADKGEQHG